MKKSVLNSAAVAGNIKQLREQLNYPQLYMAHKLKLSQNGYSRLELGHTKLTVERLFAIAVILEVDIALLLGVTEEPAGLVAFG